MRSGNKSQKRYILEAPRRGADIYHHSSLSYKAGVCPMLTHEFTGHDFPHVYIWSLANAFAFITMWRFVPIVP